MGKYKNLLVVIVLILALVTATASWSGRAQAFAPDVVAVNTAKWVWERVKEIFNSARESVSSDLWSRALDMYMQNLAYSVANELATGGPGGKPQFRTLSIKESSQKALEAAGGEFLSELTKVGFDDLGINLCDPSVEIKLTLALSLIDEQAPPKPKCDWTNIKKQWQQFGDTFANDLVKFQLDPRGGASNIQSFWRGIGKESDAITFLTLTGELNKRQAELLRIEQLTAAECQGFLDDTTTITDEVKIHCTKIKGFSDEEYRTAVEAELKKKAEAASQKTSNVKIFSKIMKDAGSRFLNTFSSKLLKQWIKKGTWSLFGSKDEGSKNLRDDLLARLRGGADIRQPRNQDIFRDLKTTTLEKVEDYNLLNDFVVCPEEREFRKPDNCVMNTGLLEAVNAGRTANEAIAEGLIDGNIVLVGKDDVLRNNSDDCYREALCYSNLVKLRKANIIPIGWELAALRSPVTSPVSLRQIIDCFEDSPLGDCPYPPDVEYSVNGEEHNPFYHLIDGNWVLKASKAMCEALVHAPVLESPEAPDRQQYCADFKTCLREDDQGNCLGEQFSYCTKSENIWRFQGDICEDGEIYSGCLNFSNAEFGEASYIEGTLDYCTADAAGCRRYSQEQRADGTWVLEDVSVDDNDLFLTRRAEECPESEAGCHEYIVMAPDAGTNVVKNGSFDDREGDNLPEFWRDNVNNPTAAEGYSTSTGWLANDSDDVYQEIFLLPNTSYALSAAAALNNARVMVEACDVGQPCSLIASAGPLSNLGTCTTNAPSLDADRAALEITGVGSEFKRTSCTFKTKDVAIGSARIYIYGDGGIAQFDDIKLEVISDLNAGASGYSDYSEGGKINIGGDRVMCTAREVGCQGYNPANGDPMIPAVITQDDLCPAECVGYASFTEQPTVFDFLEDPAAPVEYHNFIANTADSCPQNSIGCEEFTNLDEVAQGGEGREYYTYVRQCVLEFEGDTFYTWEGSDTEGYQIRTWQALLTDDGSGAPCTNVELGTSNCQDSIFAPALCGDATPVNPSDDPAVDPNCREFYDTNGNIHPRFQDRVIFASNDCHDYRRTISGQIYRIIPNLSSSCGAENNNCRAYYGNTANNVRTVSFDNFENGTYNPWIGSSIDLSTESLQNNGHSLRVRVSGAGSAVREEQGLNNKKKYQLSFWLKSDSFVGEIIPFLNLRDSSGTLRISLLNRDRSGNVIEDDFLNVEAGNWNYFTVTNYIDINIPGVTFPEDTTGQLAFVPVGTLNSYVYLDNVTLREVTDSVAVIKNSWQTPAICDDPYTGYHLDCQAYVDTNGKAFNLKSFNRLCREEAIGCMAVIDTHNSDNPEEEIFNSGDVSEITVPADSLDYLVPDPSKYCQSVYQGCSALGRPDRDDETLVTTVYKINDPDDYDISLCRSDALWCEAFNSPKGTYYFKYPGQQTCTYQTNVNISDTLYNGWFRTDSLDQAVLVGCSDGLGGDPNPGIFELRDLALAIELPAACPPNKNLCTVFKDPVDPVGCDPTANTDHCQNSAFTTEAACVAGGSVWVRACQAYYYYDNQNIDESSCLGQVDRGGGCILFYEGNNWNADHTAVITRYDAVSTYDANVSDDRPISPIACDNTNPACNANRLIKVRNDRQCSEWLACKSSTAVWDNNSNSYITVCDDLDSCIEYDSTNNITNCKKWAAPVTNPQPLTIEEYQSRVTGPNNHLSWSDDEYLGYAVPNLLPARHLTTYDFSSGSEDITDSRLVYNIDLPFCVGNNGRECLTTITGASCDRGEPGCFFGECRDDACWVSPLVSDTATSTFSVAARGYAESDAPFPSAIQDSAGDRSSAYEKANVCERDIAYCINAAYTDETSCLAAGFTWIVGNKNCEEEYQKVTYGNSGGIKYYAKQADDDEGVCIAGDQNKVKNREACNINQHCDSSRTDGNNTIAVHDGICALKTKVETFLNWQGVCMEKDESTPLITDGGKDYYCNQWYPVTTINGVSSLFDNYREAGFYNPGGQDLLFCAAAAPYELEEDRYYCGGGDAGGCNLLLKVPRGSRINISAITGREVVLNEHYLIFDAAHTLYVASTTPQTVNGRPFPSGFGYDRIENLAPSGSDIDNRFGVEDFKTSTSLSSVPIYPVDIIKNLFTGSIEKFYFDVDPISTMPLPGLYHFESECEDPPVFEYMQQRSNWCDDGYNGNPAPTEHLVYAFRYYNNDKCGWTGGGHDTAHVYCNPGLKHYYVKIDGDISSIPNAVSCTDTNCSGNLIPPKGPACLFYPNSVSVELVSNLTVTSTSGWCRDNTNVTCSSSAPCPTGSCLKYPWPGTIAGLPNEAACGGNPNCEFLKCLVNVIVSNPGHDDIDPVSGVVMSPDPVWCSDYGRVNSTMVHKCETGDWGCVDDIYPNVTSIDGCFDRLLTRVEDDAAPTWVSREVPGGLVYKTVAKNNVNIGLFTDVFGTETALGCFVSEVRASCQLNVVWAPEQGFNPCTRDGCFQMCSTISELDADGDFSWVRTDIWWRSEKDRNKIVTPPWLSYYFLSGVFVQNENVLFHNISGFANDVLPDDYFGVALGTANNQPVLVESPVGISIGTALSAATYFSTDTASSDYANLAYLFGLVYNRVWDTTLIRYLAGVADNIETLAPEPIGNPVNDAAGPSYNPRILRVCGDSDVCTDDAGNAQTGITVNNRLVDQITGHQSLFVASKFFYYAHPDHMPVRSIDINWGDVSSGFVSNPGKYKNSLPVCNSELPMPGGEGLQGFGGLERACRQGYKIFYHDYQYSPADQFACSVARSGRSDVPNIADAACYRISARVTDWWARSTIVSYDDWVVIYRD